MTSARAYIEESRIYGISNCRHNIPPTCTILDSHQRYFIWIYYVSNIPRVHTDIFIWTQFYGGIGPCSLFIWHMPRGDDSYPESMNPFPIWLLSTHLQMIFITTLVTYFVLTSVSFLCYDTIGIFTISYTNGYYCSDVIKRYVYKFRPLYNCMH